MASSFVIKVGELEFVRLGAGESGDLGDSPQEPSEAWILAMVVSENSCGRLCKFGCACGVGGVGNGDTEGVPRHFMYPYPVPHSWRSHQRKR
jgi:hypothetical protein